MSVIRVLQYKYKNSKIYILSHSWGGLITPAFLGKKDTQKIVSGWINVDGDHDYEYADYLSQQRLIQLSKTHIDIGKDIEKWQIILDFCNAHASNESKKTREKLWEYGKQAENMLNEIYNKDKLKMGSWIKEGIGITGVSSFSYISNRILTNKSTLDDDVYEFKVNQYLSNISLPILCIWGKNDVLVPSELGDSLLNCVSSTDKEMVLLQHSGHFGMKSEPEVFWNYVRNWIKIH